jgi:hypothetical protein
MVTVTIADVDWYGTQRRAEVRAVRHDREGRLGARSDR